MQEFRNGMARTFIIPARQKLMVDYARLALDAGARIIGGCCGFDRRPLGRHAPRDRRPQGRRPPTIGPMVVAALGPLVAPPSTAQSGRARRRG